MIRSRWTMYALAACILTLVFALTWRYLVYGASAWFAYRLLWAKHIGRRSHYKRNGVREWIETVSIAAIAYRVGPRQSRKTSGIPQRALSQVANDDPRWNDPEWPFNA